jgi:hypothetical protein
MSSYKFVLVGQRMDTPESQVHSFIIKLWLERGDETEEVRWHGYITHVPGGERLYLKKLSDISDFITSYLGGAEKKRERHLRLWQWLRRIKSRPH